MTQITQPDEDPEDLFDFDMYRLLSSVQQMLDAEEKHPGISTPHLIKLIKGDIELNKLIKQARG